MCANYTYIPDLTRLKVTYEDLQVDDSAPFAETKDSVFPFIYAPVIVLDKNKPLLTAKRYSLTPAWAKTEKVKWATYNARMNRPKENGRDLEYIYEIPTWREAFAKQHCLVPMNFFKESCHEGEAAGHMVQFHPLEDDILFAAGICSDWVNPQSGEILSTFAVITTDPDDYLQKIGHDRSPAFLSPTDGLRWLKPFENGKAAYAFLETHLVRPQLKYEMDRKLKTKA